MHAQSERATASSVIPLCVDLDGTLVRTDLLHETVLSLLRGSPLDLARAPARLLAGKAALKRWLADRTRLEAAHLPYREEVLALIAEARRAGRPVVLATAAAEPVAQAIADHLGLFDRVISSDEVTNLSARAKAARLVELYGERGFDYIGNSRADLPVWEQARRVIVVSDSRRLRQRATAGTADSHVIDAKATGISAAVQALRPHQWLKNLLVFVPLFAAQEADNPALIMSALLAFIGFCAAASFGYIINDLLDLGADRQHHRKRNRPFASGALPISTGLGMGVALIAILAAAAMFLPLAFTATVLLYLAVTIAYSVRLKQQVVLDVALLAGLYTIRIIAGAAATGIRPSFWLLAFSMFIFLSLAIVKRYTELRAVVGDADSPLAGRGYAASDLPVLLSIGTSSGLISVMVLALYLDTPTVSELYREPLWLWLVPPAMLYWITRLWMKAHRGEVHDDPVVFAARDRQSLCLAFVLLLIFAAAAKDVQF